MKIVSIAVHAIVVECLPPCYCCYGVLVIRVRVVKCTYVGHTFMSIVWVVGRSIMESVFG